MGDLSKKLGELANIRSELLSLVSKAESAATEAIVELRQLRPDYMQVAIRLQSIVSRLHQAHDIL